MPRLVDRLCLIDLRLHLFTIIDTAKIHTILMWYEDSLAAAFGGFRFWSIGKKRFKIDGELRSKAIQIIGVVQQNIMAE